MKNKKINYKIIKRLNPCQSGIDNYEKYFGRKNTTLLDILESFDVPSEHKIWLAVRVMDRQLVEIFAVDCALAACAYDYDYGAVAADAADAYADAADAYAADAAVAADAYAAAYAAKAAAVAAAVAADAADAYAAAYAAKAAERENQIDALIWLVKNS